MTDGWGDPDPQRAWRAGQQVATRPETRPDTRPEPFAAYFPPPVAWTPPPRDPWQARVRRDGVTFGLTTALLVLLGPPLALLWNALAPTIGIIRTASGPQPTNAESSALFAPDGWFVLTSILAGVVVGVVAWVVLRKRGPAAPFGLAAGGLLSAVVAAEVGSRLVVDKYVADFCKGRCIVYNGTLHLNATAAVVVLPVTLLVTFAALTLFLDKDDA